MNTSSKKSAHKRYDLYGERLRLRESLLSKRLLIVAKYIDKHRAAVLNLTAVEIASKTKTSDATVIRTVQALGFSGLRDLKNVLADFLGETPASSARMATTMSTLAENASSSIDFVLNGYQICCQMLSSAQNREAITQSTKLLLSANRVAVFGLGASSLMAEYAARLFNRSGKASYVLNRTGVSLSEQLIGMREGDVVILMAQRSAHREGTTTVEEARRLGIKIILITGSQESPFAEHAQHVILIPRSAESGKMPIHGITTICLEILVLSLTASAPGVPLQMTNRLYELNNALTKPRKTHR